MGSVNAKRKRQFSQKPGGRFRTKAMKAMNENDNDKIGPAKRLRVEIMVEFPSTITKRLKSEDSHNGGLSAETPNKK